MLQIGIVAGEPSGDRLAAGLIESLRARRPEARFVGIAGPKMVAAGCEQWASLDRLAVMGLPEILARYREIKAFQRHAIDFFRTLRPDVFIAVDAPEFNLGIEEALHADGIRTAHYVSPTVWAWREGRLKTIARAVDLMLVLFPFEEEYYRRRGLKARFAGHPMIDELESVPERAQARAALELTPGDAVLAVLPGSRMNELKHHAEAFLSTAAWCRDRMPALRIVMPLVDARAQEYVRDVQQRVAPDLPLSFHTGHAREALSAADAALVVSGTATLEAMLLNCPMVVAYRASWLSYCLIRPLVRIRRFALPNVLGGEEIVPEFIQGAVQPQRIGERLLPLLADGEARRRMLVRFAALRAQFPHGASDRAAAAVLDLLGT